MGRALRRAIAYRDYIRRGGGTIEMDLAADTLSHAFQHSVSAGPRNVVNSDGELEWANENRVLLNSEEMTVANGWVAVSAAVIGTPVAEDGLPDQATHYTPVTFGALGASRHQEFSDIAAEVGQDVVISTNVRVAEGTEDFRLFFFDTSFHNSTDFTATTEWQKVSWTDTASGAATITAGIQNQLSGGVKTIHHTGFQIQRGSVVGLYLAVDGAPRYDPFPRHYDEVAAVMGRGKWGADKVMEVRNSAAIGGDAATDPTNWTSPTSPLNGITTTINERGVESGWPYMEYKFSGTATSDTSFQISFEPIAQISANAAEERSQSLGIKIADGNVTGFDFIKLTESQYDSGPAFLSDQNSVDLKASLTSTRQPFSHTITTVASTASVRPHLTCRVLNTNTVDLTLRIYVPQEELGLPTPPQLTYGTARTVLANDVVMDRAASGFDPNVGAVQVEYVPGSDGQSQSARHYLLNGSDSGNVRFSLRSGSTVANTMPNGAVGYGSGVETAEVSAGQVAGVFTKTLFRYGSDEIVWFQDEVKGTPVVLPDEPSDSGFTEFGVSQSAGSPTVNSPDFTLLPKLAFIRGEISDAEAQARTTL